ncbi:MAG: GH92 family glycosyl hydrolase [Bacteroidales bacterium]|nr:GH92 family glycosyl hydrolase [Bacteroidales bacterium]
MKKYILLKYFILIFSIAPAQELVQFVNPFIGTTNFGATNPGAIVPQGMVSVVPFNVTGSDKNTYDKDSRWWSTPYSWDNSYFTGYSHVNLSGVGCPELGVILLMPTTGRINANIKEYGSEMSLQNATPGYYSCKLDKYNILTEVSATKRSGINRFTFPKGQSNVLIDLGNGLTNESGAYIQVVGNNEVEGYRLTGSFCYQGNSERPVFFVARFNKPANEFGVWKKMPEMKAEKDWSSTNNKFKYYKKFIQPMAGDSIGAWFSFDTQNDEQIIVQVGISYVSIENARLNLDTEQIAFDFDKVKREAEQSWENTLSKIKVEGGTDNQKTIFYTALYHMNIHPNMINDVNGEYPLMESFGIGKNENRNRYTVFSLWDTYRNFHPFMSLVYPDLQLDMVNSMVDMYKESGWLPKWELNGKETYTMNGDPAFPVITDTYLRGLTDFDINTAYEAMIKSATTPEKENKIRSTNDFYLKNGYVPLTEKYDNSVSVALEYYIADWNLGQLAKALNKNSDYQIFNNQSLNYMKYFDKKEFKMIRPKLSDGTFLSPFNPMQGKNFEPAPGFHEGTAWNYTFCVQHDIPGLIKLMGGKKMFTQTLQKVFTDSLFDMTNEPDMHYPFLFNYVHGEEWRAQKEVNSLMHYYFKNSPGGLPGNDDCGTMSAWIAFSMMGLYPVCPGDMDFAITIPVFDKVTIKLDSKYYPGKTFEIITNKSKKQEKIKEIIVEGKALNSFFISHKQIIRGGKLEIITN